MVPKTAKAVLYTGTSGTSQLNSTKLMSSSESAVNATGSLVFYYDYYIYDSLGTVYPIDTGVCT